MRVRFSLGPPYIKILVILNKLSSEDSLTGKTPDCKSGALWLTGSSPVPPTKINDIKTKLRKKETKLCLLCLIQTIE